MYQLNLNYLKVIMVHLFSYSYLNGWVVVFCLILNVHYFLVTGPEYMYMNTSVCRNGTSFVEALFDNFGK